MKKDGILLTQDGHSSLKKELEDLKNNKLPEVIARVAKAREDGDLSENSAYQFGKQEQEFLEGRIEELEEILKTATMVAKSKTNGKKTIVDVGCKVTLFSGGKRQVYFVVGDWEASPKDAKVSGSSPLGKALLGKKVGDKAEVEAPAGKVIYTILDIE